MKGKFTRFRSSWEKNNIVLVRYKTRERLKSYKNKRNHKLTIVPSSFSGGDSARARARGDSLPKVLDVYIFVCMRQHFVFSSNYISNLRTKNSAHSCAIT